MIFFLYIYFITEQDVLGADHLTLEGRGGGVISFQKHPPPPQELNGRSLKWKYSYENASYDVFLFS